MLYINKDKNSIAFDELNYDKNFNYMMQIAEALGQLDKTKTMHFIIDLPESPMIFMLYIDKVRQSVPNIDIRVYHKEDSQVIRTAMQNKDNNYYSLNDIEFLH